MDLLSVCHGYNIDIDIAPNFYSALSLPYNLQVKVTDLEILC